MQLDELRSTGAGSDLFSFRLAVLVLLRLLRSVITIIAPIMVRQPAAAIAIN